MLRHILVPLFVAVLFAASAVVALSAWAPAEPDFSEPSAESLQLAPASEWLVIEDAAEADAGWTSLGPRPAF